MSPSLMQILVVVFLVLIFFGRGRISNFINSELYGTISNVPWSVIFVKVDNLTRHPSQLYEAFFEDQDKFKELYEKAEKKTGIRKKVLKAMKKGKFNTVLGTLSFDKKGDVTLPGYVFYEWSKGNYNQL